MKLSHLLPLLLFLCFGCASSQEEQVSNQNNFPEIVGAVNDFEGIFTKSEAAQLENKSRLHRDTTTEEIVIVTIDNIEPYEDILLFGTELANYWGVGQEDEDNGVLIVVSKTQRKMAICLGYGMEDRIGDIKSQEFINHVFIPQFKKGMYFQGCLEGVNAIMTHLSENP
ncbi:MAG: TPM domain-containing protein [Flavobacteriia bacterium]|nr:TPM domain-containing protein [Flavobacteriia bacterium]